MTAETQSKPWGDLEEVDLAWFIIKAYNEGKIDGDHLAYFISNNVYWEHGSLYKSSTEVMKDFLVELKIFLLEHGKNSKDF